ncbi:MAG: 30S ribosomal protein S9 [Candidatus Caldarchaeum sp.]|nr:30S ribosomal protein S9 [Candidatus Caldarchaeum sp.]MDW7978643.1 30S ribosomal protein S9 [Candidatus Caldarchaeum sp.]MDW8360005.1 30S ribosomal protein S9 [Candidatus Caldarchaeum sp.]
MKKTTPLFVGRRKTSVAKVVVKPGKGNIFFNKTPLNLLGGFVRSKILTPLKLIPEFWNSHDFFISVKGGGVVSSADAAAIAISKAISSMTPEGRSIIAAYDRHLLVDDPRQAEPKKPNRRSARRFKQKSYR